MESDQLEEYRRMAQSRHAQRASRNDAALAQQLQEEENKKLREQAKQDEEIAKKLNAQYAQPPVEAYPAPASQPAQQHPGNYSSFYPSQPSQAAPPVYSGYQNYPPPNQAAQPYYQAPPQGARQPLIQPRTTSVLPAVTDKCCGVNTQVCVLTTAGVLTASVLVTLVMLLVS